MGSSLSWLATKGKPSDAVLAELELRATGAEGLEGESPALGGTTHTGWYLIVLDGAEHQLIGSAALERLSRGCEVVTCTVEEHVMFSEATGWRDGRELWKVTHRGEDGPVGLDTSGTLPPQFAGIRDGLMAQQAAEDTGEAQVDFLFEIPVVLSQSFTGYKHDEDGPNGETVALEVLEPTANATWAKRSWFQRLLGR